MPTYVEQQCPRCGAPLPSIAPTGIMHCAYCATALVPTHGGVRMLQVQDEDLPHPDRPRLWLGGRRYVVLGRIAQGEASDVFYGSRDHRLAERVILKVLRALEHRDLFDHEYELLERLQASTHQGREHFTRLLPQPVAHGEARLGTRGNEGPRWVSVFRFHSGFVHTFEDVRKAYPDGIPPETSIWLWKRILETLAWVHRTGQVHGAVLPAHLLVHARDHGVRLVGWSRSVRTGQPLRAFTANAKEFYPESIWAGESATRATDLTMSARCALWLLSGDCRKSSRSTPTALAELLCDCASDGAGGREDAWELLEKIDQTAQGLYGPPKYVPFEMPGWSRATS